MAHEEKYIYTSFKDVNLNNRSTLRGDVIDFAIFPARRLLAGNSFTWPLINQ